MLMNVVSDPKTGEASLVSSEAAKTSGGKKPRKIWEIRTEEQYYAFLKAKDIPQKNRYGQAIDLIEHTQGQLPVGRSMYINENPAVGDNPHRNKQHGFFFTADNCIGCHACEAACSEKNENPAHIAFRSVGYVEGGSFPDYKRMNISMACNHCDDPVCLKGCPTRAYTKHVEYGAVLQDPETCFGCGYCTWVCPYNAPQLDPVKGQVSKCNMCVDRLEVGLKPACVSACVGNALDFGVIETVPERREQALTEIPGFPSPEITRPNIRFQQIKQLPDEMKRTDSQPVKYHKDANGKYKPTIDAKKGKARHWNLKRLSSRENPLVLFTLSAQAVLGAFALLFLGAQLGVTAFVDFAQTAVYAPTLIGLFLLVNFGLFMSTMHLGKPHRFYRGFNNLRHSPVSREGLGIALFIAGLGAHIGFGLFGNAAYEGFWSGLLGSTLGALAALPVVDSAAAVAGWFALVAGAVGLYYMNRCYRIKARPFWNHWQVGTAFVGNGLSLGGTLVAAVLLPTLTVLGQPLELAATICTGTVLLGMALEGIGHWGHSRDLRSAEHEGGASYYVQTTTFGKTYVLRNVLLGLNVLLMGGVFASLASGDAFGWPAVAAMALSALVLLATCLIGRALFYILVIPTTMPGAFFWKNKGFEEHARDIGLAHLPQVGVVPLTH